MAADLRKGFFFLARPPGEIPVSDDKQKVIVALLCLPRSLASRGDSPSVRVGALLVLVANGTLVAACEPPSYLPLAVT